MGKSHAFRHTGLEMLEGRMVMSGAGVHIAAASQLAGARVILTQGAINRASNQINNAFESYIKDYRTVFTSITKSSHGNPSDADVNRFFNFLDRRGAKLANQLGAASYRVPFGGQNLGPVLQDRAFTLTDDLASVSTIEEAAHPLATIRAAQRGTLQDLRDYISFGVSNGDIVLKR